MNAKFFFQAESARLYAPSECRPSGNGERSARAVPETRYVVTNHPESGTFPSMTDATVWALENVHDWNWRVEPMPSF